jgi:hypothetical protein
VTKNGENACAQPTRQCLAYTSHENLEENDKKSVKDHCDKDKISFRETFDVSVMQTPSN